MASRVSMLEDILYNISDEVDRQEELWGIQHHRDGTGHTMDQLEAEEAKRANDEAVKRNQLSWHGILKEEFFEAVAEKDVEHLREELVQVAAVCVSWILDIDSRSTVTT